MVTTSVTATGPTPTGFHSVLPKAAADGNTIRPIAGTLLMEIGTYLNDLASLTTGSGEAKVAEHHSWPAPVINWLEIIFHAPLAKALIAACDRPVPALPIG